MAYNHIYFDEDIQGVLGESTNRGYTEIVDNLDYSNEWLANMDEAAFTLWLALLNAMDGIVGYQRDLEKELQKIDSDKAMIYLYDYGFVDFTAFQGGILVHVFFTPWRIVSGEMIKMRHYNASDKTLDNIDHYPKRRNKALPLLWNIAADQWITEIGIENFSLWLKLHSLADSNKRIPLHLAKKMGVQNLKRLWEYEMINFQESEEFTGDTLVYVTVNEFPGNREKNSRKSLIKTRQFVGEWFL